MRPELHLKHITFSVIFAFCSYNLNAHTGYDGLTGCIANAFRLMGGPSCKGKMFAFSTIDGVACFSHSGERLAPAVIDAIKEGCLCKYLGPIPGSEAWRLGLPGSNGQTCAEMAQFLEGCLNPHVVWIGSDPPARYVCGPTQLVNGIKVTPCSACPSCQYNRLLCGVAEAAAAGDSEALAGALAEVEAAHCGTPPEVESGVPSSGGSIAGRVCVFVLKGGACVLTSMGTKSVCDQMGMAPWVSDAIAGAAGGAWFGPPGALIGCSYELSKHGISYVAYCCEGGLTAEDRSYELARELRRIYEPYPWWEWFDPNNQWGTWPNCEYEHEQTEGNPAEEEWERQGRILSAAHRRCQKEAECALRYHRQAPKCLDYFVNPGEGYELSEGQKEAIEWMMCLYNPNNPGCDRFEGSLCDMGYAGEPPGV